MIKLNDLVNREYEGKKCIKFYYVLKDEEGKELFEAKFKKKNELEWSMKIVIDNTRDSESQVYNFGYILPKADLPLELIAAIGLKYFQLQIENEMHFRSNVDYELMQRLEGM